MNIKQLRAFREVMLTGSVSEAARNLHRTQPAVSSQIAGLEDEIGLKLFIRRDGRLHPVPEAQYLLAESGEILERLDNVKQTLGDLRNLESGNIRIVAMPGPSVFLLPQLVSQFVRDREDVNVTLISRSSFQVQQLVSAQQYDVGLADMMPGLDTTSSLLSHETINFRCVCAVPSDDPLAQKGTITPQDLDGKPLAMLFDDHPMHTQIRAIFEQHNLFFNQRFETQYFIPSLTFVEQRQAFAIVDPLSVESYHLYCGDHCNITFLPFSAAVNFSVSIVTPLHRPLSNLAVAFTDYLKTELQKLK